MIYLSTHRIFVLYSRQIHTDLFQQVNFHISLLTGPPILPVIKVLERKLTSVVISWDTFSHTSCGDVTYNVTLSDGTAELVEERTTNSNTISFTDLDNDTQYEVTVLAINNAGPATAVTTNVTTLTPSGSCVHRMC